jgi:hypothetical protein
MRAVPHVDASVARAMFQILDDDIRFVVHTS